MIGQRRAVGRLSHVCTRHFRLNKYYFPFFVCIALNFPRHRPDKTLNIASSIIVRVSKCPSLQVAKTCSPSSWLSHQSSSISNGGARKNPSKRCVCSPALAHSIFWQPADLIHTDIQSELHQKKRRFTDFIFQRVQLGSSSSSNNKNADDPGIAGAAAQTGAPTSTASTPGQSAAASAARRVRSPRSVSTTSFPKRAPGTASAPSPASTRGKVNAGGVPVIRTTSPGAEFREERALAAARRKQEEAKRERLKEPIHFSAAAAAAAEKKPSGDEGKGGEATEKNKKNQKTTPSFPTSIRRFHISRPSTPSSPLKTAAGSGVAKSSTPTRTRAVLVEKLTQAPSLRGASILETLEKAEKNQTGSKQIDTVVQSQLVREDRDRQQRPPQKRPVVNQAEKKWREQQKESISAAKENLATKEVQDDDYLDRLAKDLEQVMLDIESEETQMDGVSLDGPSKPATTTTTQATAAKPNRTPLKYAPRHPTPRKPPVAAAAKESDRDKKDEDMDEGYVYDTYIRIPVPRSTDGGLTDPLSDTNTLNPSTPHDIDPTRKDIGLVVITEEDEDLWENFLENDDSDEENWDGEDVDSNGIFLSFPFFLSLFTAHTDSLSLGLY